jgi:hypothetical protein
MPAPLPGPVSVPLANGTTAIVAPCEQHLLQRVQLEIPTGIGVYRDAKWMPGSPSSRSKLSNGAMLTDLDAIKIEDAAIAFLATLAAARTGGKALFKPFAVDGFQRGSLDRKTFAVESITEFLKLCAQPVSPNYFLEWKSARDSLTVLDVDWHNAKFGVPMDDVIDDLMLNLRPMWAFAHRTSRGFHAGFIPFGNFTANELAAAAMAYVLDNPIVAAYGGSAELITRTRHPLSVHNGKIYGHIHLGQPDASMPSLACFSSVSCDDDEAKETMAHLNLEPGRRYPHSHCPMRPEHRSSSHDPVVVHADGVHCFSCQRTWSWGALRRKSGLPMRATAETSIVRDAIANWVPHSHVVRYFEACAPWIGQNLPPPAKADLLRTLHSALIKRHFADALPPAFDLRLASVFQDFPYVRGIDGMWLDATSLQIITPKPERADTAHCSSVQVPHTTKEGLEILEPDLLRAGRLAKNGNLPGWMPIQPIPATPVWHVHNEPAIGTNTIRVRAKPLYTDPLQYIPDPAARMSKADCERVINRRFPCISFAYLTLMHIGRALGEQGACQLAIAWATGQTGTAKTSTAYVEAALHDEVPENLAGADENKIRDMLGEAQGRTGIVLLDDLFKAADSKKREYIIDLLIQFILQYNRSLTFHKRHVAMMSISVNTMLLLTDLKQPRAFMSNAQLGRRVAMVHLDQQCPNWSVSEDGVQRQGFKGWWRETPELRKAAESWHSWVCDEFLPAGATTEWKYYVERLGFQMLSDYADNDEVVGSRHELVRKFVAELIRAPDAEDVKQHVFTGAKEIQPLALTGLATAARDLVEYNEGDDVTYDALRIVLEPYQGLLHQLLPLKGPCFIQLGKKKNRTFARLREQGKRNHATASVNAACLPDGVTPENILDFENKA